MAHSNSDKLFWTLQTLGWSAYAVIAFLGALAHGKGVQYWPLPFGVAATAFVLTCGCRLILRRAWNLPSRTFVAIALGCVVVGSAILGVVFLWLLLDWCKVECRPTSTVGYIAYGTSHLYVMLSWVGLYAGIKYYRQLQQQNERVLAATAIAHEAQLKMLRYQLNPHFLFNTLNAISTLILDRSNTVANRMVQGLSAFLRHSLDSDPMQKVTLKQELDALNLYLGIEKIRFADRLAVETRVDEDCYSALLPGMLLQPIVENAVKYAIAKLVEGGTIEIRARRAGERLHLSVADNGPGHPELDGDPSGERCGVGLRNTRERLRVLYGEAQSVELRNRPQGGLEVTLALPFETGPRLSS